MKLLLDQGLPRSLVHSLSGSGHPTTHVADLAMAAAPDEDILALAIREHAVIVTMDSDYHTLLALRGLSWPSVIRVREQSLRSDDLLALLLPVLELIETELRAGVAVSLTRRRLRYQRLPVGRDASD